jgi:hypothetical protein
LRATTLADGESGILFDDPQFAFCHEYSLAPNACANETAPVPGASLFLLWRQMLVNWKPFSENPTLCAKHQSLQENHTQRYVCD